MALDFNYVTLTGSHEGYIFSSQAFSFWGCLKVLKTIYCVQSDSAGHISTFPHPPGEDKGTDTRKEEKARKKE